MTLPDFSKLFEDGREIDTKIGRVVLRTRDAGGLALATGRVVACDPLGPPEIEPFARVAPAGTFPVTLSVAHFEDGDRRVAAALVRFGPRAPASWEPALLPGESPDDLAEGEIFGYPVDSGTGCFMDAETARLVLSLPDFDDFFDALNHLLDETYENTWSWANLGVEDGHNVVAFSTGVGDGLYASYFGLGEDGEVVCLVTDFSLFEYEQFA